MIIVFNQYQHLESNWIRSFNPTFRFFKIEIDTIINKHFIDMVIENKINIGKLQDFFMNCNPQIYSDIVSL